MEHALLVSYPDIGINRDVLVTPVLKDINIILLKRNAHVLKNIPTLIWITNVSVVILQTFGILIPKPAKLVQMGLYSISTY